MFMSNGSGKGHKTRKMIRLVSSLAGIGIVQTAFAALPEWAKPGSTIEKCAGNAKKGQNDCGANGHSCAANGAVDNDPNEWVYMPKGVCDKITGSKVIASKQVPEIEIKKVK